MDTHTIFHLNWIRENGNGNLDADLGTVVPSNQLELAIIGLLPEQQPGKNWGAVKFADLTAPWRMPQWAWKQTEQFFGGIPQESQLTLVKGFCNRIRDKAWNLDRSQLFLPYFGKKEWPERFSLIPDIRFEFQNEGVVAAGMKPHSVREIAMRTAAGVFAKSDAAVPVRWESRLPLIEPWRNSLLERYGLDVPAGAPALKLLTIASSGNEMAAWASVPRERHCHYYSVFSPLALTIQHALRRWMLAAFTRNAEALADFETGADALVFAAIRPHAKRRCKDFSYDVLNSEMMDYAFDRAARRLEPLLKTAAKELTLAGFEDDARLYLRRDVRLHANKLAQRARRRSRVRGMLVSESVLIYSMMKFARSLKSLGSARDVTDCVDELAAGFNDRIRKIFFFLPNPDELGTLMFLEATNAIHRAMGGDQELKITCETVDGARYEAARPVEESFSPM